MCKFDSHSTVVQKLLFSNFSSSGVPWYKMYKKTDACKVMEHNVYKENVTSGYN